MNAKGTSSLGIYTVGKNQLGGFMENSFDLTTNVSKTYIQFKLKIGQPVWVAFNGPVNLSGSCSYFGCFPPCWLSWAPCAVPLLALTV